MPFYTLVALMLMLASLKYFLVQMMPSSQMSLIMPPSLMAFDCARLSVSGINTEIWKVIICFTFVCNSPFFFVVLVHRGDAKSKVGLYSICASNLT